MALQSPSWADQGFCADDVARIGLYPELIASSAYLTYHDPGYAQLHDTASGGLRHIAVLLGGDAQARGASLAEGSLDVAALAAKCRASIPNCLLSVEQHGPVPAIRSSHDLSGLKQTKLTFYFGGESLLISATVSGDAPPDTNAMVDRTVAAIKPQILPPC